MSGRVYKVPFVGDANVGKTSIVSRFVTCQFCDSSATVGMTNVQVNLCFSNEQITVDIWDTAGQERYRSIVPLYTRDSHLIALIFSVASSQPFQHLEKWCAKIRNEMQLTCPLILRANKTDLDFAVERKLIWTWCREHKYPLVMTSAKTGENVEQLFTMIAELL